MEATNKRVEASKRLEKVRNGGARGEGEAYIWGTGYEKLGLGD